MVTVVDEISYIIDLMRTKGMFTVPNVSTYPSGDITICGNQCASITSLPNGEYSYYSNVPYYYHGSKVQILNMLVDKNKRNSRTKYPALILEENFSSKPIRNRTSGVSVELVIMFVTPRIAGMTNNQSYEHHTKPILYPLLEKFIEVLPRSESVFGYELKDVYVKNDYGDGKIMATDYWDVVALDLKLTLLENCKKKLLCQM